MRRILQLLILMFTGLTLWSQPTRTITDGDLQGNATYNWSKDTVYILDGYVFLEEGGVLNIPAGTVIKGLLTPSNGVDQTSALIITRGAQIFAEGTAAEPIIFTAEIDDLSTTTDLTADDNQLWGGLILLGRAPIGEDIPSGSTVAEDVIEGIPSTETRIFYGGDDPDDNSGTLKYVSIRHGGSVLGANNEINGLTMGGVGRGTTIDYIEIFANKDDGIETFGGTVSLKHAVVAFCGDDSYDFDESWDGSMQFLLSLQLDKAVTDGGETIGVGDNAVEYDGSEAVDNQPKTVGRLYNATFIGAGLNSTNNKTSNGIRIRNDGAAQVWNSIVTEVPGYGLRVDDTSLDRLKAGEMKFPNNLAFNIGEYVKGSDADVLAQLAADGTVQEDPQLGGISRTPDGNLDPRPNAGSPVLSGATYPEDDDFITKVSYRGAFSNRDNWAMGWTALSQYGYFGNLVQTETNVITDADIEAGETLTLTNDKEYILDGYVFVEEGATIIIEPGTVVRGRLVPSNGVDQTSALIITRGGKIIAEGTKDAPIIFTAEIDDLATTTDLTADDNQLWGGLILLGNAPIGEDIPSGSTVAEDVIEGIPSTEPRIFYGGNDPDDNSGILKYVSIRHGGSVLGANNEINGLTMGGVGRGTTIDYIEVFANKDDGIETFGGTVSLKHAVVAFCGDDSYDFDESWDGSMQFLLSIQLDKSVSDGGETIGVGDNAVEYDGSEAVDNQPKTVGRLYNATFIGAGLNSTNNKTSNGIRIRNDGAAEIWNSIVTEVPGYGVRVDDTSLDRLKSGEMKFPENLFYNIGTYVRGDDSDVTGRLTDGGTVQEDPQLGGISREPNALLDPRPNAGSPALSGATYPDDDAFITKVAYKGAFSNTDNWAQGWTALSQYGYFGNLVTTESNVIVDADIEAGETLTLTNDKEYILDGYVFVEEGATIIIEPGTVVRGRLVPTNGVDQTSALIITRGGKIIAEGTKDAPIIFTAEIDDLNSTTDLTADDNQLWGGLILLGKAPIGEDIPSGSTVAEDVIEGIPSTEPRIFYGGNDPDDNSGILKYVSIRHGGSVLGANNEINGLTMGGVGRGTTIDYIEVFANKDDGIETFGGTVSLKHAVVAFCGDDSYDFDESWDGSMQFLLSIQLDKTVSDGGETTGVGDNAVEYDGSEAVDNQPKTVGRLYNATFIGAGLNSENNKTSNGIRIRNDGAAQIWNSIITEVPGYGMRVDDTSLDRLKAGEMKFPNNLAYNIGEYVHGDAIDVLTQLVTDGTMQTDPDLGGISREPDGGLDPRPNAGSPALSGSTYPDDDLFIDKVDYRGAFSNTENWAMGWTALSQYGYFGDLATTGIGYIAEADGYAIKSFPNPSGLGFVNLDVTMPKTESVQVGIYDLNGRLIKSVYNGQLINGNQVLRADVQGLTKGIYLINFKSNSIDLTKKLILIH